MVNFRLLTLIWQQVFKYKMKYIRLFFCKLFRLWQCNLAYFTKYYPLYIKFFTRHIGLFQQEMHVFD